MNLTHEITMKSIMKTTHALNAPRLLPVLSTVLTTALAILPAVLPNVSAAAVPGITGGTLATGSAVTFNLVANASTINEPDGQQLYSWGYGCTVAPGGFAPAAMAAAASCSTMQVPGPTLIVTEGQVVTVVLTNSLPTPAGNTSMLFPGFAVTATGGAVGLLTQEATPGATVTYTFTAGSPGTRAYYSGTQGDLQVEMGLYGAIVVLPKSVPAVCTSGLHAQNLQVETAHGESDFTLSKAAYDHSGSCYDREYIFQFAEADMNIHRQAQAQVSTLGACVAGAVGCALEVPTEPYHPSYFMINGRSMPDDMDPNFALEYPHQPYNGNPHMHPGELTLLRIIGQGRWQHPFHEHANHVRILARDGNMVLSPSTITYAGAAAAEEALAGPLLFTTTTTPGLAMDGIFYFTGRGLNWDMYAHNPTSTDATATLTCTPDANGYNTGAAAIAAVNYYEWCADHNKPLQATPLGDVPSGGPVTLPDPNIFTNGAWYGGSPYLGQDATTRATGPNTVLQPSNVQANPAGERGWAYMWHSHNEREITTNNVFPGGMMMMMLVDSREFVINETN